MRVRGRGAAVAIGQSRSVPEKVLNGWRLLGARDAPESSATFHSRQRRQNFDTGSASRMRPSSTSVMMATEVIALVMEAMEKIASVLSGSLAAGVAMADGFQVRELAAARNGNHGAGYLLRVDLAPQGCTDTAQPGA